MFNMIIWVYKVEEIMKNYLHKIYMYLKKVILYSFYVSRGTDIQTILLSVNNEVSREGRRCKQMPVHEVAMRMKLVLLPVKHWKLRQCMICMLYMVL